MSHLHFGQHDATKNENYMHPHSDMCTIRHEDLAQCLKLVQRAMEATPDKASDLYKTCRVYLGCGLACTVLRAFQDGPHGIPGRVSKGSGAGLTLKTASEVLAAEFQTFLRSSSTRRMTTSKQWVIASRQPRY